MKARADVRLVELGLAPSREKARSLIMAGCVSCNGAHVNKPGFPVGEADVLAVKEDPVPFVSRGGLKLQKALDVFGITLTGAVAADVGASTGGFTDCMLKAGAVKVYALDVGYGQLAWELRQDPRVVVMERRNARHMEPSWFAEPLEFAAVDVSFISTGLILPALYPCLAGNARAVVLVKPQFEAGRAAVGKHGVVRDPAVHLQVLRTAAEGAARLGYCVRGADFSPITGPKGNIEFLLHLEKGEGAPPDINILCTAVQSSHKYHKNP